MAKTILLFVAILVSFVAYCQRKNFEGSKKINGTTLHFNVRGNGEYLLAVHGGPGMNHAYFIPHLAQLEKKFTIIYYDQRSCGRSSVPSADSISIKFLVDDIEAIRKEFKIEKLNILSHSWGAVLATHYALAYPHRINKMVFSNPAMFSHEYDHEAGTIIQQRSTREDSVAQANIMDDPDLDGRDFEKIFLLAFKRSAYNKDNLAKLNLMLPDNFSAMNTALFTALSKDPTMNVNLYDSLQRLKFPVLIIHGQADVIPKRAIERLKDDLPQGYLLVFEKSGHFPFVEQPLLYNDQVKTFLEARSRLPSYK